MREKKPKAYCFKPRVNEAQEIIEFIEKQSNLNDAIRYLIEKEITENGIRDLVKFIPAKREIGKVKTINSAATFLEKVADVPVTIEKQNKVDLDNEHKKKHEAIELKYFDKTYIRKPIRNLDTKSNLDKKSDSVVKDTIETKINLDSKSNQEIKSKQEIKSAADDILSKYSGYDE